MSPILPVVLFPIATLIHYCSLRAEARTHWYTRHFGVSGFWIHASITGLFWVLFSVSASSFMVTARDIILFSPSIFIKQLSTAITVLGIALVAISFFQLGFRRTWGIRFFPSSHSKPPFLSSCLYRYLQNPMYDGCFLIFLGTAMHNGSLTYLVLATESALLLNWLLARFENTPSTA